MTKHDKQDLTLRQLTSEQREKLAAHDPNSGTELVAINGKKDENTVISRTAKITEAELEIFEALFKVDARDIAKTISRITGNTITENGVLQAINDSGFMNCHTRYSAFREKASKIWNGYEEERKTAFQHLQQFEAEITYLVAFAKEAAGEKHDAFTFSNSLLKKIKACSAYIPKTQRQELTATVLPALLPMEMAAEIMQRLAASPPPTSAAKQSTGLPEPRKEAKAQPVFDIAAARQNIAALDLEQFGALYKGVMDLANRQETDGLSPGRKKVILASTKALSKACDLLESGKNIPRDSIREITEAQRTLTAIMKEIQTGLENPIILPLDPNAIENQKAIFAEEPIIKGANNFLRTLEDFLAFRTPQPAAR